MCEGEDNEYRLRVKKEERRKKKKRNVFFFKQKTAYEIKECDWSSDVCSSDLRLIGGKEQQRIEQLFR